MNTYLSTSQRVARGNAIREYRKAKIAQNNYLAEQKKQQLEQLDNNYKSDKNVFVRAGATILDIGGNVLSGAVKGLEGIMDLGAGVVGAVGGIFDKDFQNDVKGFISKDYTTQYITNPIQEATKDSYTNNMKLFGLDIGNFIEETASGVGQMLPSVAMNVIAPGSGLGILMAGAMGNSTEQAFNDGASYGKGLTYGVVSGGIEGLTEKMFNGLGGLYGGGVLDKYTNKVAKQGASRILKNALEEGVEEVVAELANPLAKSIYKGTDALKEYGTKEYWQGVAKAGALGASSSFAFNGTVGQILNFANGTNADIDASIESINNINEASQKLFANNKLTNEKFSEITSDVGKNYKNIEKVLEKQTPEKRAKLIDKYRLNDKFEDNGKIKSKFALEIGLNENNADLNNTTQNVSNDKLASAVGKYINPNMRGRTSEIQTDLDEISKDAQTDTPLEVFDGELTDTEQSAFTKTKKALNRLNTKSGKALNIVVVNSNDKFNALIKDDKIYMSKDALESGEWAKAVIHEYTHFAEGTKEYVKLFKYLTEDSDNFTKSSLSVLSKNYGFDEKKLQNIAEKLEKSEELTEEERKYHKDYLTETTAHMTENVLGNEKFIDKIVRSDDSLAEKILNKIDDLVDMFKAIKSADGVSEYRKLRKTQRLYMKAIEASGKKYVGGKIIRREEDELKYSKKEVINLDNTNLKNVKYKHIDGVDESNTSLQLQDIIVDYFVEKDKQEINKIDKKIEDAEKYLNKVLGMEKEFQKIFLEDAQNKIKELKHERQQTFRRRNFTRGQFGEWYPSGDVRERISRLLEEKNGYGEEKSRASIRLFEEIIENSKDVSCEEIKIGKRFVQMIKNEYLPNGYKDLIRENKQLGISDTIFYIGDVEIEHGIKNSTEKARLPQRDIFGFYNKQSNKIYIKISRNVLFGKTNRHERFHKFAKKDKFIANKFIKQVENSWSMEEKERLAKEYFYGCNEQERLLRLPFEKGGYQLAYNLEDNDYFNPRILEELYCEIYSRNRKLLLNDSINEAINEFDNNIKNKYRVSELRYSLKDSDFDKMLDDWFNSLTKEELDELIKVDFIEEKKLSKAERRELYIKKLYDEGKLNSVVTKLVNNNPQMKEYFKDTQMNKKYDPLALTKKDEYVVMFHGTKSILDFFEFDSSRIGTNGTQMGSGFYFTEAMEYAKGYTDEHSGRIIVSLLNIKKPLSRSKHEITKQELKRFIKGVVDSTGEDYLSNYGDVYSEGYDNVLNKAVNQVYDYNSNDADMIEDIYITSRMDFDEFHDGLTDMLGYDGIIAWNKAEGTQAIVFKSNQIKDIFNTKPTTSADIRYSKKDNLGRELSQGQQDFFKDSKIRVKEVDGWHKTIAEDGNLLEVYHGTNSDEFFEFDRKSIGSANDLGWYGRGYYFAFSESEAKYYGNRVMKCYLNIKKPFFFTEEMQTYDGVKDGSVSFDFASFVLNLAEKFPEIAKTQKTDYVERYDNEGNGEVGEIDFVELANKIKELYNGDRFEILEFTSEDRKSYKYVVRAELKKLDIDNDTRKLIEEKHITSDYLAQMMLESDSLTKAQYDKLHAVFEKYSRDELADKYLMMQYSSKEYAEKEKLSAIIDYIRDYVYRGIDMHMPEYYMQDIGEDFRQELIKQGYDGVVQSKSGDEVVAFYENQIKLTSNKNPTESNDIRYSMKGQAHKIVASKTKVKAYNKAEAERVINDAIELIGIDDKYAVLKSAKKEEIIDKLWIALNSKDEGYRGNAVLEVADFLLDNATMESAYEDEVMQERLQKLDILREYTKRLNLNAIKDEIKHRDLKDAYMLWGVTNKLKNVGDNGITADVAVQELNERGFSFDETNEADCFNQIYDLHKELLKDTKKQYKATLNELASPEKRKELQQQIARELMWAYEKYGTKTQLANTLDKYVDKINTLKTKLKDTIERNNVTNRVLDKVQKFRDMKLGRFINATQYKPELFKDTIGKLGNIKFRGDLNKSGTRDIIRGLNEWYSKENERLGEQFNIEVSDMLTQISVGNGDLTTEEIRMIGNIADYFKHFIENYNKIYREGKYVEAIPLVERYINIINHNKKVKVGWLGKFVQSGFYKFFGDPLAIMRRMDNYRDDGFFTETFRELEKASIEVELAKHQLNEPIEEFLKKNKTFLKDIKNESVDYNGTQLSKDDAFSLYLTLKRKQAQAGLMISGFKFKSDKDTIRVDGLVHDGTTTEFVIQKAMEEAQKLYEQFSEVDREYIKIAERLFNEDCKNLKKETDLKRQGYSNVLENEHYYPISRAFIAHNVDTTYFDEVNRASNASFNKDTVKGAKGELAIEPLTTVLNRHTSAIAMYSKLSIPIDNYNRIFNLNIGTDNNKTQNINSETQNVWEDGNKYFKKLISDIQGIKSSDRAGSKIINFLRGSYAKYQLGLNPKVWLTQLSSYFASFHYLSAKSLTKGFGIKVTGEELDKYCKLAMLRNADNTAGKAQSVMEKVDKVGDALMTPIGKMDRLVVKRLFGACQVEVESEFGLKIGSDANKVKAGEMLERVILDTQQNSIATARSSAMRSENEIYRSLTMFTADSMKNLGRWVDSVSKIAVIKAELKTDLDADTRAKLESELKQAKKEFAKSSATMVVIASFMALIAQGFKWLYNKDDEDENIAKNMATDTVGNLIGGLPILKDAYSFIFEGYEMDTFVYSMFNDVLAGFKSLIEITEKSLQGENLTQQDVMSRLRKFIYSISQVFGIPMRNAYNLFYGITSKVSPSAGYKINGMFYDQNYRSDLQKAIEKGDDEMIETLAGLITNENVGKIKNKETRAEINRLVGLGLDALPKSIGDTITHEGEEIKLNKKQRQEFEETYSEGLQAVTRMMKTSLYEKSSDEIKAKSVKFVYDYYYEQAKADLFGLEDATKTMMFAEAIDIETLAIAVQTAKQFEADLDKNGKSISGTKKAKVQKFVNSLKLKAVQKYMIMGYLGYTNKQGESSVKAYINTLNLTKAQKEELLKMSGY